MNTNSTEILAVLRTQSITGLVQKDLERQIVNGSLKPGDPLRESSIAASLGISRGPVREAFRMLEERGLVAFTKNCGVHVRKLDGHQAAQIYQVRVPLEGLIGELAAQNYDTDAENLLTPLMQRLQHAVDADDVSGYAVLNLEFHDALARLTGNNALYDTYMRLVIQLKLFRSHTFKHNPETIKISLKEHQQIMMGIREKNAELVAGLLQSHAQNSFKRLQLALECG